MFIGCDCPNCEGKRKLALTLAEAVPKDTEVLDLAYAAMWVVADALIQDNVVNYDHPGDIGSQLIMLCHHVIEAIHKQEEEAEERAEAAAPPTTDTVQ